MPRARTLPPHRRPYIGARHDPTGGCVVCGGHDDAGTIRVCEECDAPYHCTCHSPPLIGTYEEGDWLCAECAPASSATPS
ncbi:MAG: hypothetical protein CBB71_23805 [Rhodopirellula sp. TMED11]|nr:MAG: hypothetical protein CBB71_23805 [Rhodopirellula sp. TMED11]